MAPVACILPLLLPCLAPAAPQGSPAVARAPDDRLDWWQEARFGLFIHWGLYSVLEGEWQGRDGYAEWIRHSARIPVPEYEKLLGRFDPQGFDADAWTRLAREAGMGYLVITTKHHDGFCLFDSKWTDFDVMSTPFQRDIMAEIAAACRRNGLRVGWYHSIMDWHHPDYLPRRGWERAERPEDGADFDRYVRYLRRQVTELLTNYGTVDVLWFDGQWEGTWTHEHGQALYELCRRLQPRVLVNNRVDKGRGGAAGAGTREGFAGDFGTPEQEVPERGLPGVAWETCMTMNRHWGWNKADRQWKSTETLVRTLADIAGKGGNLLLNVGPKPDGTFPEEAVERLRGIGAWMKVHGEAIHGTHASPFGLLPWGRCTVKRRPEGGTRLYLHVFDWPADGVLRVPGLGSDPLAARLLEKPGESRSWRREGGDVLVVLPAAPSDPVLPVLALDLDGPAVVYRPPEILAPSELLVDALEVELRPAPGLEVRYTLDGSDPGPDSPRAAAPLRLTASTVLRAASFHEGRRVSTVVERRFEKVAPWPVLALPGPFEPGLEVAAWPGDWDRLPEEPPGAPAERWTAEGVALGERGRRERLLLRFEGVVEVPATGVWRLFLRSDDGSRLWLDGRLVVDNDGLHGPEERDGVAPLAAGAHHLRVEWFNKTGGADLRLRWSRLGEEAREVGAERLRHPR